MNYLFIFDWLSLLALFAVSIGVLMQWRKIYITRSVHDIETKEVFIRFFITLILLVKIFLLKDVYLIIGQTALALSLTVYFLTLLHLKRILKN